MAKKFVYFSVVLWVLSFVALSFVDAEVSKAYDFLINTSLVFYVCFFLVMPLLEELVFRAWLPLNRKWMYWMLPLLSGLLFLMLPPLLAIAFLIPIGVLVWWHQKAPGQTRLMAHVALSSIVFGIVHIEVSELSLSFWVALVYFASIGFVLAYVRLRHGLGWSIAVHYGYNFIIMLIGVSMGTSFAFNTRSLTYTNEVVKAQLTEHAVFDARINAKKRMRADTLALEHMSLNKLVGQLLPCKACKVSGYLAPKAYSLHAGWCDTTHQTKLSRAVLNSLIEQEVFEIDSSAFETIPYIAVVPTVQTRLGDQVVPDFFGVENITSVLQQKWGVEVNFVTEKKAFFLEGQDITKLMSRSSGMQLLKEKYHFEVSERTKKRRVYTLKNVQLMKE